MLEITNLRMVYPNGHEALKSISFSAEKGETIAIIGRSGAGKSTLLRCINGLQRATSGTIMLDNEAITSMTNQQLFKVRRQIGFIWQEYSLVERSSALTNVLTGRLGYVPGWQSLFGYFGTEHREIALRNLARVNLLPKATNRADRLSGGEKQRVAIARALTQKPKILLADEPVASLDPELAAQVMEDLARVTREDGLLTLINIHQIDLMREFADRAIGIAQGEIVFDGRPDQLDAAAMDRIYRFDKEPLPQTIDELALQIVAAAPVEVTS